MMLALSTSLVAQEKFNKEEFARRRAALYDALLRLGGQVFLTGADPAVFAELEGRSEMFEVSAETGVRPWPGLTA